jgi:multimeric flavodoxin WrbA
MVFYKKRIDRENSMVKVLAINANPKKDRSHTGMILEPLLEGFKEKGAEVDLYYASELKVKPCACGHLYCWHRTPGECIYNDSMSVLYQAAKEAQIIVFGSPVYSPIPGDLQNIINRFVALLDPILEFRDGRTRARLREDVQLEKVVLVAGTGWWERENVNLLEHVLKEFAENGGITYSGTIVRPHVYIMQSEEGLTPDGKDILKAIRQAAYELMDNGEFNQETLDFISRPLISCSAYVDYLEE